MDQNLTIRKYDRSRLHRSRSRNSDVIMINSTRITPIKHIHNTELDYRAVHYPGIYTGSMQVCASATLPLGGTETPSRPSTTTMENK